MLGFSSYTNLISEAKAGGILHIEHPSDLHFDGPEGAKHAVKTLRGVASGKTPITRKVDDKTSFQVKVGPDGKVHGKYKGTGAEWASSDAEVDKHYAGKPYAGALKTVIKHIGKVLPQRSGEYQGGFLSTPETRTVRGNSISHAPNTIRYKVAAQSPEGRALKRSKVSVVLHTELEGPERKPRPILNTGDFRSHPDVHVMSHVVDPQERHLDDETKKKANEHLDQAEELMKDHSYDHLKGHEQTLRQYYNAHESGHSAAGYAKWLAQHHNKKIATLKTEKGRARKTEERDAIVGGVKKNAKAFNRTFQIHHHTQEATNILADALGKQAHGGYHHEIEDTGKATGPEGFVANGLKVVNRREFSAENRRRGERFKKK